jgi:hypothetical protein
MHYLIFSNILSLKHYYFFGQNNQFDGGHFGETEGPKGTPPATAASTAIATVNNTVNSETMHNSPPCIPPYSYHSLVPLSNANVYFWLVVVWLYFEWQPSKAKM